MNAEFIMKTVFDTVNFSFDKKIEVADTESGLICEYDGKIARVGGENESALARAYFLFAKNISEGKTNFCIKQNARFSECGIMLDSSRNAVMKTEGVKKYINYMACSGMNMLMLYAEDTYTVEKYPYFGYMRGRYSEAEIKEIVSYGEKLGVEVVPCIQTLAHFAQFLKWGKPSGIADCADTLLCDDEKTYEFIEDIIKANRAAYKTNKIHIGMDEAHNMGLGKYMDKHGAVDRTDLFLRHLNKVCDICRKYDFEPMIWSDMFFRLGTEVKTGTENYEISAVITDEIAKKVPDVGLVFWDYYHKDKEFYDIIIKSHKNFNKDIIFAGGIATWYGFTVWGDYTYYNTIAAMKSCLEHGIKRVLATAWGDNGGEANMFLTVPYLTLYSEYCWLGEDCTEEDIISAGEFLSGYDRATIKCFGEFAKSYDDNKYVWGKDLFYSDIFYNIGVSADEVAIALPTIKKNLDFLSGKLPTNDIFTEYMACLYKIIYEKAKIRINLRPLYEKGDKAAIKELCENEIDTVLSTLKELKEVHKRIWYDTNKSYGWEVLSFRYGGVYECLKDRKEELLRYVNGEIGNVEILDEKVLPTGNPKNYDHPKALGYTSPSEIH